MWWRQEWSQCATPSRHWPNLPPSPTYRSSVLDILVTDMGQYYCVPTIRPPVQPDDPAKGSPSDHNIVFVKTKSCTTQPVNRVVRTLTVRPLPEEALAGFASWVQREPWTFVYDGMNPSDMFDRFNFIVNMNFDHYCRTKSFKSTNLDGKLCSVEVKQACRRKNRKY